MDKYQDIIDKYLEEKMSAAEKLAFEERLLNEPDLRQALELESGARELVRLASRERLKSSFNKLEEKQEAKVIRPVFPRRALLLAASVALLLIAGYWISNNFSGNKENGLFAQYHEVYRAPTTQRGEELSETDNWEKGINFYKTKDFSAAISEFKKALSDNQAPDYLIHFYLGQSYLAKQPPELQNAVEAFRQVQKEENFYLQQTKWYLALAYLRSGDIEQSKRLLSELKNLNDFKHEEAAALLIEIGEQ